MVGSIFGGVKYFIEGNCGVWIQLISDLRPQPTYHIKSLSMALAIFKYYKLNAHTKFNDIAQHL